VQGTYAKPVYAKTPENPPHCHIPLNVPPRELFSTILFVDDHLIFVATFSNIFNNSTFSVFCLYRLFFSFFLDFRVEVLFSLLLKSAFTLLAFSVFSKRKLFQLPQDPSSIHYTSKFKKKS
jgi:hypothetical protein